MNIELQIERLVLDGVDVSRSQGALVKAAVEMELTRLLGEGGIAPHLENGGAVASIGADPIRIDGDTDPASLGERIAGAVYGGIGR